MNLFQDETDRELIKHNHISILPRNRGILDVTTEVSSSNQVLRLVYRELVKYVHFSIRPRSRALEVTEYDVSSSS